MRGLIDHESKNHCLLDYYRTLSECYRKRGVAEVVHLPATVEGRVHVLGYPLYFLTIIGLWRVLGAIAILVPRFPRLKEWAYAGIFFDLTGAAASHAAAGDYGVYAFHIRVTLFLLLLLWHRGPFDRQAVPSESSFPAKPQVRESGSLQSRCHPIAADGRQSGS